MKIKIKDKTYENIFKSIECSGSLEGSSRILNVTATSEISASTGDAIVFINDEGNIVFQGRIFTLERDTTTKLVTLTAYDNAIYLNRNYFVKNFYDKSPSEITKEVCGEIGLSVGELPEDCGVKFSFPALDRSAYDIILTAYTLQHRKDGKIYSIVSNNGKIEVIEQGTLINSITLSSKSNISDSKYSETVDGMINQIIIYKTENDQIQIKDKAQNIDDINKYGTFQNVIQYTEDNKAIINPKEMLKGLTRNGRLKVLGHNDLISGYTVIIDEPNIKLVGQFLIAEDKHCWTSTSYTTELTLTFENTMNRIEVEEFKIKAKKKGVYSVTEGIDRE